MGLYDSIKKNYNRKVNFKLNESCKSKKKKVIKEAIDMDRLRAARGRETQQKTANDNSVKQKIMENIQTVLDKLNDYGYTNLLEVGNYLQEIGLIGWDPSSESKRKLYADGIRHNIGYTSNGGNAIETFSIEGGGACGDVGFIFYPTKVVFSDENCRKTRYNNIDEITNDYDLRHYADIAQWAANGVDKFIAEVEKVANEYADKYPELQESGSKEGAAKRKINRRRKNIEWLKSQVDKKPMADLSDEDKKAITKSIDKSLSTYKECNKKKPSKTMVERARSRKRNPIIESGRTYNKRTKNK